MKFIIRVTVQVIRPTFIFLLAISSLTVIAQESEQQKKRNHAIYPLNIGFTALIFDFSVNSYQIAYEQNINQMDGMLFGIKYHERVSYPSSIGYGFELQYRFNFNRDSNVEFKSKTYLTPYFEYDNFRNSEFFWSPKSMITVGAILVNKFTLTHEIILELLYGFGLSSVKYNNSGFGSDGSVKYLSFKAGIQLGFAF